MIRSFSFAARIVALVLATVFAGSALAEDINLGDLTLSGAFTRAMPPAAKAGGGFVTITNKGAEDDRLIAASSPAAGVVELHEMKIENDIMVMREMEGGIAIPAGQSMALKPGGLHLMFMQVTTPFKQGEPVSVTLTFEKAGDVTLELPVAAIGASGMAMEHGKMEMKGK